MTFLPRQTSRPGLSGLSTRPIEPGEAKVIQNLLLERDGVWKPRPGLTQLGSDFASDVTHVSIRPSVAETPARQIVIVEGGNLRRVSTADGTSSLLDTGWPDRVKTTIGGGTVSTDLYWLAHKSAPAGLGGNLYRINPSGVFASVAAAPIGKWVENYGLYTFTCNGSMSMRFSESADSDTWPALNELNGPRECGSISGLIGIDENRMLIVGEHAVGVITGASEDVFSVGQAYNIGIVCRGSSVVKCGNKVAMLGPGSRLYLYNPDLERIDGPVEDDLATIGDATDLDAWYDTVLNAYCLSSATLGKTLLFDLEKRRWIGSYDKALVGMGTIPNSNAYPNHVVRYVGYGKRLCYFDATAYTDDGAAFTCQIDVGPEFQQMPEGLKQIRQVYLDAAGTWTATLLGRNSPEASFTTLATKTGIVGPAWFSFARHLYRERIIRLTATAASGVALRGLKIDERIVRTARS